mgnify:CR=1 FL=1
MNIDINHLLYAVKQQLLCSYRFHHYKFILCTDNVAVLLNENTGSKVTGHIATVTGHIATVTGYIATVPSLIL